MNQTSMTTNVHPSIDGLSITSKELIQIEGETESEPIEQSGSNCLKIATCVCALMLVFDIILYLCFMHLQLI